MTLLTQLTTEEIGRLAYNVQAIKDKIEDAERLPGNTRSQLLTMLTPQKESKPAMQSVSTPEPQSLIGNKLPVVMMLLPMNSKSEVDMMGLQNMVKSIQNMLQGSMLTGKKPKKKPKTMLG